jgi:hypothetical protein
VVTIGLAPATCRPHGKCKPARRIAALPRARRLECWGWDSFRWSANATIWPSGRHIWICPGIQALLDTLSRSNFRRELESLGGYDTKNTGARVL